MVMSDVILFISSPVLMIHLLILSLGILNLRSNVSNSTILHSAPAPRTSSCISFRLGIYVTRISLPLSSFICIYWGSSLIVMSSPLYNKTYSLSLFDNSTVDILSFINISLRELIP